jgi:hypothetical protein
MAATNDDSRPFSVMDDIGFSQFGDSGQLAAPVVFSPDQQFFVVTSEKGRLDAGRPEATLRIYRVADIQGFLLSSDTRSAPPPAWAFTESRYADPQSSVVSNLRWLADSTGFAFLVVNEAGNQELFLADLRTKVVRSITPADQFVTGFTIRDANHLVYSVPNPAIKEMRMRDRQSPSIVGTGRSLVDLLLLDDVVTRKVLDQCELWAILGNKRFRIENKSSGKPLLIYSEGVSALALSPNGRSLVTSLAVNDIPADWESKYPAPRNDFPMRIRAGHQDLNSFEGRHAISEFITIELASGDPKPLTNTPTGLRAGWSSNETADWSRDGNSVLLSDTFMPPDAQMWGSSPTVPCVAVVDVASGRSTCVESQRLPPGGHVGCCDHYYVTGVQFLSDTGTRVRVEHAFSERSARPVNYSRVADGSWEAESDSVQLSDKRVEISVEQDLNTPPKLVAMDLNTHMRRVILDPNPQLKNVEIARASVYKWTDKAGRDWVGGLYWPPHYVPGRRYPLVIQTHGFDESRFEPSGYFPVAFAAQALAASGIVVLQSQECSIIGSYEEGPCNVDGFEAIIDELDRTGIIDADEVGIIGFSRTCYHVMKALTASSLRFKAASITDGVEMGYLQYQLSEGLGDNRYRHDAESANGASPFGSGLQQWLENSPEFNLHRITAPLQVVAEGSSSALMMWEPYAALRYLKKPVDFIVLNTSQHVLTNPRARLVSQGGTVDWFRFWLQGYEDPNPAKAEQYQRWEALCIMQAANDPGRSTSCVGAKTH